MGSLFTLRTSCFDLLIPAPILAVTRDRNTLSLEQEQSKLGRSSTLYGCEDVGHALCSTRLPSHGLHKSPLQGSELF